MAVHKIYVRPSTDLQAWEAVVQRFADVPRLRYGVRVAPDKTGRTWRRCDRCDGYRAPGCRRGR